MSIEEFKRLVLGRHQPVLVDILECIASLSRVYTSKTGEYVVGAYYDEVMRCTLRQWVDCEDGECEDVDLLREVAELAAKSYSSVKMIETHEGPLLAFSPCK